MTEEKFKEIVGIAIGEASVCWSEVPKGIFNSDRAIEICERIIKAHKECLNHESPPHFSDRSEVNENLPKRLLTALKDTVEKLNAAHAADPYVAEAPSHEALDLIANRETLSPYFSDRKEGK